MDWSALSLTLESGSVHTFNDSHGACAHIGECGGGHSLNCQEDERFYHTNHSFFDKTTEIDSFVHRRMRFAKCKRIAMN